MIRTSALALAGVGAAVVLLTIGLSGELFGRMTASPRMITATADQVAVIDGDTLRLDGVIVRLSDIKAPPRGQPCGGGSDCGGLATAMLASLVRDRRVDCRVTGHDSLGRPSAQCDAGGADVNATLVGTGWARAESPALDSAESDARAHRRGIWLSQ